MPDSLLKSLAFGAVTLNEVAPAMTKFRLILADLCIMLQTGLLLFFREEIFWVAIINAKFQIRERRYHQCPKPPNFKSTNAANLTFDFGGYDYWHLRILADTALTVLKFGARNFENAAQ